MQSTGDKSTANRQRIVEAADRLFYHKGYNQTSFTDIARASGLPRGNFYYYFKAKDEILRAVIEHRVNGMGALLEDWAAEHTEPRERLRRYARLPLTEAQSVLRYGCPVGSLNVELSKTQGRLQAKAGELFDLMTHWLARQFEALGYTADARDLALHLIARVQGVSLVANAYADRGFLKAEVESIERWVESV